MESRQYEQDRYNQMKIYIPTFRRVDNQITFNTLPDKIKQNVIMVVQEQEREQYKYDCEYLIVDNNIGIAKTRELIYHHAGTNYFGMLDDDITFYLRNSKYFKNELKPEDSFKSSKQDFSPTDEENFNSIINSSENQNNDGKKVEKKVADELTDSFEYSKDDSNQFEKLMKFKKNPNQKISLNQANKADGYSAADEELFKKFENDTNINEVKKELDRGLKSKKIASSNNIDHKKISPNTQEYSKEDLEKFEKLFSKE